MSQADAIVVPSGAGSRRALATARFLARATALAIAVGLAVGLGGLVVWMSGIDVSRPGDGDIAEFVASLGPWTILLLSLSAGVFEELVFRVLPLGLALWLARRLRWGPRVRPAVLGVAVLATSAGFAYAHGDHRTLAFQGLGGIVLASAFLREEARYRWKRAALLVMTAHAIYDLGVFGILHGVGSVAGAMP